MLSPTHMVSLWHRVPGASHAAPHPPLCIALIQRHTVCQGDAHSPHQVGLSLSHTLSVPPTVPQLGTGNFMVSHAVTYMLSLSSHMYSHIYPLGVTPYFCHTLCNIAQGHTAIHNPCTLSVSWCYTHRPVSPTDTASPAFSAPRRARTLSPLSSPDSPLQATWGRARPAEPAPKPRVLKSPGPGAPAAGWGADIGEQEMYAGKWRGLERENQDGLGHRGRGCEMEGETGTREDRDREKFGEI